ncbi:IucA/IucC family protein [Streptomyces pristinaespiralis]|uniref:Rhizobactin siderophore biosynthesis protein rhbC n=2 Tax=Streptomyces pristinaespiralis TaxID=38300 RepID=B5H8X2_STRE2|nr:IucA/IucC family protein [Streptomyces pristinaespiralis]ALC20412.1 iron transporter [Streptomyces pristinaespiralis]EDY63283.1 rhizobactin siderophore biosynthesis protein rhbC [Streptomyces pristinaespiralis ATCC 25486]
MNPTPAPDAPESHDGPAGHHRSKAGVSGPLTLEPATVPRQTGRDDEQRGGATAGPPHPCVPERSAHQDADHLDDPDPRRAADTATVENLLRCWVRENALPRPDGDILRVPLDASGTALLVPVRYWSATGWHRFGPPTLQGSPHEATRADAVTVAALLGREAGRGEGTDLVGRVADSVRRTADFIADRRARPTAPPEADLFLTAEQSLLLGHPLHPTPKSREGLSEAEAQRYSPELYGSFPLHWMAVDRSLLAAESAWTEQGRTVTAEQLTARLAGGDLPLPADTAALPLHPWQAQDIRQRPAVAALLDAGLLHDLGPRGDVWYPTSSVRTVHRPGVAAMLKLSLGLRITNSRRENLRKELHRGVEVHRLLRAGLAEQWRAAHPGFDIVRDPAWLAVDAPGAEPLQGLDVMIRHNPFGPGDDAVCVAALTTPRPWPGREGMHSRLALVVERLAAHTGRPVTAVAAEWFLRYLDHVVRPVLWLDATAGIALEAHQQNTLVLLDPHGWPTGGRYRDNQGYYFRESHRERLTARLPGIGTHSDTFVSDDVTDERFAYYLGINNVLGLIGAFGAQRLADERVLLAAFRQFLTSAAGTGSPLPGHLLQTPTLRCKANLLTRLHGLDELVGPVDTQSVYVTIANPLRS